MAVTKEILNSHPATTLKKEIAKTNIKGYSKMKKAELVDLMMKNKEKFGHIRKKGEASAPASEPKPKKTNEERDKRIKEIEENQKKRKAKKEEKSSGKETSDKEFVKNMENTPKDLERLFAILRKYGTSDKDMRKVEKIKVNRDGNIRFTVGFGDYEFDLKEISSKVKSKGLNASLKGLKGKPSYWFGVFSGIGNIKPFTFKKLFDNDGKP